MLHACRHNQRHSSDELLRLQSRQRQSWRPQPSINSDKVKASPEYTKQALKDALYFYETLQVSNEWVHWSSDSELAFHVVAWVCRPGWNSAF